MSDKPVLDAIRNGILECLKTEEPRTIQIPAKTGTQTIKIVQPPPWRAEDVETTDQGFFPAIVFDGPSFTIPDTGPSLKIGRRPIRQIEQRLFLTVRDGVLELLQALWFYDPSREGYDSFPADSILTKIDYTVQGWEKELTRVLALFDISCDLSKFDPKPRKSGRRKSSDE